MSTDFSTILQLAGAAQQVAGTVQTFRGAQQTGMAAADLLKAGTEEAAATLREANEIARTSRAKAWASVQDAAFLSQQTEGRVRAINAEEARIQARIEASAAGSGIEFSGSPVAVAAEAALAAQYEIQNARLTESIGRKQFLFEAEESLLTANEAKVAGSISEAAVRRLRGSQAGVLSRQAQQQTQAGFSALLGGAYQAAKIFSPKSVGGSSLTLTPGEADY